MQTATEAERKYDVPDGFAVPDLSGVGPVRRVGPAQRHTLEATYYDTDDLRLARHRITLRRRTGGSDAGWHLKTPGDGTNRTEHRLPLGDEGGPVPAELGARVRAVLRDRPLRPVARLRTRRDELPLLDADGRVLALLADDTVDAESDGTAQRWREVEVELVDGDTAVLDAVGEALAAAGASPAAGPSKLGRVLGDRVPSGPPRRKGRRGAVADYVREQRDAVLAHDPAARAGDEEAVHDMRVAVRRLRSSLRTFRGLWAEPRAAALRDELAWLGDRLGALRDVQVMRGRLAGLAAGEEFAGMQARIRSLLDEAESGAHRELTTALDDDRYLRLLDELDAVVDAAPGAVRVRRAARRALRRADRRLAAAQETEPGPDRDHRLHAARRAYKRARYAAEALRPTAGGAAGQLIGTLTRLQDVLGTHQDAVITSELLRDYAGRAHAAGDNGFGYGVLSARQQQAAEQSLGDLPAVTRALRRRRIRRWLG